MDKIMNLINKHFKDSFFTAREFSNVTGMDRKVSAMNLKRLSNRYLLGHSQGRYYLFDDTNVYKYRIMAFKSGLTRFEQYNDELFETRLECSKRIIQLQKENQLLHHNERIVAFGVGLVINSLKE